MRIDQHRYRQVLECLLAAGTKGRSFTGSDMSGLQEYLDEKKHRWIFGHLNYDLKNRLEDLHHPA